jgi:trimeric autotransporter adhesin
VALALASGGAPPLQPGRRFAVSANVGTFDGAGAFAAGATGLLFDSKQYSVVANASVGLGFNTNVVGGRGGVSLQW